MQFTSFGPDDWLPLNQSRLRLTNSGRNQKRKDIMRVCLRYGLVLAVTCLFTAAAHAADDTVRVERDVVYATVGEQKLQLDLFVPQLKTKPPLVVWVHGGGWRAGSRKNSPLQKLTSDGFAVASISYRFTDRAIFPAQIHDCKGAIRWLRANADKYGFDGTWIAVGGSSAGGHLALLLGTSGGVKELEGEVGGNLNQSSTVQAVIDFFGPADFALRGKTHPQRAYTEKSGSFALLGGLKFGKVQPELEKQASPTSYVDADDPPLLIFHGDKDTTVLLLQSQHMVKAYKAAGLQAELVTIPGAGHGIRKCATPENLQRLKDFLQKHRPDK